MNELASLRERYVEVKGDLPESTDQLGEDHKMLLHVRVCLRANRIKDANKVCFLIGKTDVAITKVKGFGKLYDSGQLQISFLLG